MNDSNVAKLGDHISSEDKRKLKPRAPRSTELVEAKYMNMLVKADEHVNGYGAQTRIAKMLGMSAPGFGTMVNKNECRIVYEIACKAIYLEKYAPKPKAEAPAKVRCAVLKAESHQLRTFKEFAEGVGATFYIIPDAGEEFV